MNEQSENSELTAGERHQILSVKRRRILLDVLSNQSTPVELISVATAVARQESAAENVTERTTRRVAISLHHTHLPILTEHQVLDYDSESNRIAAVTVDLPL
ncbi:DUF7344 domain-containing protein [Haloprofundus halobius]|uniref:DUF7344 domain-containing protein n=1 Tax=Haloprofundus halobius TaxID=2876194 RepID=UPI001CCA0DA4|nr:hypothetical protein [Haloprofundus halobius]